MVSTWMPHAFAALERRLAALPPPLDGRFSRVRERLTRAAGTASLDGALSHPESTPGLALLEAYRRDLAIEDGPVVATIGEATLLLYLHVRVQDDLVDEPALFNRAYVYLAELFSAASVGAFARALGGGTDFFAFRERVMARFSTAATWEIDVLHAGRAGVDEHGRIGEKLLPVAIPLGALACLAGVPDEADHLVDVVLPLATALQTVNDVLNIRGDHVGRRPTPTLLQLYRETGLTADAPLPAVRLGFIETDLIERACAAAHRDVALAAAAARRLGREHLAESVAGRARIIDGVPAMATAMCLGLAS